MFLGRSVCSPTGPDIGDAFAVDRGQFSFPLTAATFGIGPSCELRTQVLWGAGVEAVQQKQITCGAPLRCGGDRHVVLHAVASSATDCKPFIRGRACLVLEPSLFRVRLMPLG